MNRFLLPAVLLGVLATGCDGKPANRPSPKELTTAIMMGDGPKVSQLAAAGADLEYRDPARPDITPLLFAVSMDQKDVVDRLLTAGAKIDGATSKGVTPLFSAAMSGHAEIAGLLIDKGANVNARNSAGTSVLVIAVTMEHEEIARRLIEKGADVDAQTGGNRTTALMMAAHEDLIETAKLLVGKGASTTVKDAHGKSAIDYAKSDEMKNVLGGGR